MAITDLTGTTWTLKNALVSYPGGTYSLERYQINIETSESIRSTMGNNYSSFESILIGYNSGSEENEVTLSPLNPELTYEHCQIGIGHDTKTLPDIWRFYYSGTFTITGGTDVTNSTLITWLEENSVIPFTPSSNFLDGSGVVDLVTKLRTKFQQTLISGTNIKTINNESLLGSGDIPVGGGSVTSVGATNATNGGLSISGSPVTTSGTITIGHSNILSSAQTTQAVYPIKIDKNGHISAYGSAVTIPTKTSDLTNDSGFITSYTDTKNTAGSTNSTSKLYLIGATEQSANPQTYSNSNLYYDSINGFYVKSPTDSNGYSCIKQDDYGCTNIYAYSSSDDMPLSTILVSSSEVFLGNRNLEMGYNSSISISDGNIYLSPGANDKYVYIYNLGAPSNDTDAATKKYVDDSIAAIPAASITLNGASTTSPSFYAPTTAGTSGYVLASSGSGAPDWISAELTDTKVSTAAIYNSTAYYPVLGTDTTSATTKYYDKYFSFQKYDSPSGGVSGLTLGNNIASGTTDNRRGYIHLYGKGTGRVQIEAPETSYTRVATFPDKTGTVALTSDIPSVYSSTNTSGYLTMATLPIYNGAVI